jgi:hypothetical protein
MRGDPVLSNESFALGLARQRRVDPQLLAEVQAHCWMDGNRVVVDQKWLVQKVGVAFAMGSVEGPRSLWDSAVDVVNIPGNIARVVAGREHRARVVDRMDVLDDDLEKLSSTARQECLQELEVQLALTQLLGQYREDVSALWNAYKARYKSPLGRHEPWPEF